MFLNHKILEEVNVLVINEMTKVVEINSLSNLTPFMYKARNHVLEMS